MNDISSFIEAILFTSGEPLKKEYLKKILEISRDDVDKALVKLQDSLKGRGIALVETEQDVTLRAMPSAAPYITAMRKDELSRDIGKAGIETLAIILYRNGACRSDIDWIRGVNSSATIRSLTIRGLIKRSTDANNKRRIYYSPTIDALAYLGVTRLEELPQYSELTQILSNIEKEEVNTMQS